MEFKHLSVMLHESIDALNINRNGTYIDCTLGGGGHSFAILKELSEKGRMIGIDQDEEAIKAAKTRLKIFDNMTFVHDNFSNIDNILNNLNIEKVDGILMDLGVSSYQLDNPDRGFSYMKDAPLDMRMNSEGLLSAYNVVNEYSEQDLYRIIRQYGEENFASRIARFIVENRKIEPITTTLQLVEIIKRATPVKFRYEGSHPAKKTFQAIRIEVNHELEILEKTLESCVHHLNLGGRIVVITFHSLEDRIVKNKFKQLQDPCTCPKDFPICVCEKKSMLKIITKKPLEPSEQEIIENSRSKSSKLRIGEKISSN
jgi:16S rRNA (cytosine1402-N4)-methyltransferase